MIHNREIPGFIRAHYLPSANIAPPPKLGYDKGMDEESDKLRPRRRIAWLMVAVLVAVFVLYPLSIGPACVLVLQNQNHWLPVEVIYWPLIRICEATGTDHALKAYILWWLDIKL